MQNVDLEIRNLKIPHLHKHNMKLKKILSPTVIFIQKIIQKGKTGEYFYLSNIHIRRKRKIRINIRNRKIRRFRRIKESHRIKEGEPWRQTVCY